MISGGCIDHFAFGLGRSKPVFKLRVFVFNRRYTRSCPAVYIACGAIEPITTYSEGKEDTVDWVESIHDPGCQV